ncbi:MAG: hypothetical protein IPL79_00040 [Myxococcales bacterium]|nr:hypothetical protein [Myxococcales bacterium]
MATSIEFETGWVLPPKPIGGLDHLGVQAPCTALYAELLPGITNVTDRARYYAFHPWLIWQFDRRYPEQRQSRDAFARVIRRAECMFVLIAIRHSRGSEDQDPERHDAGLVGRQELQKVQGDVVDLDDFAGFEAPRRYFKNRLGGLGQYYFGPLRDLRILDATGKGRISVPGYDQERGVDLATAFDEGVDADRFFAVLEAPTVSTADLDALASVCPCHLATNAKEREALRNIFLARSPSFRLRGGERRRSSLGLTLELIAHDVARHPTLDFEEAFRVACYTGTLPTGTGWSPPKPLVAAMRGWGTYHRNELFSVALQGLFAAVLDSIVQQRLSKIATSAEAGPIAQGLCGDLGGELLAQRLDVAIDYQSRGLPGLEDWQNHAHEIQLGWRCTASPGQSGPKDRAVTSVTLLLALAARGLPDDPYCDFELDPDYFDRRNCICSRSNTS